MSVTPAALRKLARVSVPAILAAQIARAGLPTPEPEVRFHPTRRWRFDLAWPDRMVAIECDGATWTRGRHTRGAGYAKDCEKANTAQIMGWTILRFTTEMVESGEALAFVVQALEKEAA